MLEAAPRLERPLLVRFRAISSDRAGTRAVRVRELLEDETSQIYVSRASLWELSAKAARGRLPMPDSSIRFLLERIEQTGMITLPIETANILRTENLPHHHGDPFDRLIVAQALEEGLTILTSDSDIPKYDAPVIWK